MPIALIMTPIHKHTADKMIFSNLFSIIRLGSGQPTNVIVDDGQNSDDEEDETFVVEETAPPPQDSDQVCTVFNVEHMNTRISKAKDYVDSMLIRQ